jgi:hypothetical protein
MEFDIGTIFLGLGFIALIVFTLVREGQHQRIIRDLTAKILAKDLGEYKQVAEGLHRKAEQVREKKEKIIHPVLGKHI